MSHFFAYISRLKFIRRWSLMRNITKENSQEHSWQVATIAHALAIIKNQLFQGNLNPERAAVLGLYHDISETITGDLPTPVKYANAEIRDAYHDLERQACNRLIDMLPQELHSHYTNIILPQGEPELELVGIADKICAYIKCSEELTAGNMEFAVAHKSLKAKLATYDNLPEVNYFMKHFIPSFDLTLDELR